MKNKAFIQCNRCNRIVKDPGLLHYKNGYPCLTCKACIITELFNSNCNEDLIKKWCKEFDIPYLEREWNYLINNIKEQTDFSDKFVHLHFPPFGKYLAQMKLPDWINMTYEDGIKLNDWRKHNE